MVDVLENPGAVLSPAFVVGGLVARIGAWPFLRGAAHQPALAGLAAALTFGIGTVVGGRT
jgi:hypothetical protein